MKTLSIGITTFKNRLNDIKKQIVDIKNYDKNIDILLAINTNYNEKMPEEYRKDLLMFCCQHENIYPLMFSKYTGLSKMWNNLIVHSSTSHIFIMNDDITFNNPTGIEHIKREIESKEVFKINNTFGMFIIPKNIADKIGYFDERLIAYGEEDGDFKNRYFKIYNKEVESVFINGIDNRIQNNRENSYDINIQCFKDMWGGNKPLINRKILNTKSAENWSDEKQY